MTFQYSGVKVVLFDLDGTITDSVSLITRCFVQFYRELYGKDIPAKHFRKYVGPPLAESMLDMEPQADPERVEDMIRRYRELYVPHAPEVGLYDGIETLLRTLKQRGYRLAVATSKMESAAEEVLDKNGIRHLFETVSGGIPGTNNALKSEAVAAALTRLNATAQQSLMVGDRCYDIEGAASHGVAALLATWADTAKPGEEAGAIGVVSTPAEVAELLPGVSKEAEPSRC